jgi:hypothetical protein
MKPPAASPGLPHSSQLAFGLRYAADGDLRHQIVEGAQHGQPFPLAQLSDPVVEFSDRLANDLAF